MSLTELMFLAAVVLPPVALALGFLYLISPQRLNHHRAEPTVVAKAH